MPQVDITYSLPATGRPGDVTLQTLAQAELAARLNAGIAMQRQMMIAAAIEETRERDLAMQRTLENDVRTLDDLNARIDQTNQRVLPLLQTLTGLDFGADPERWRNWWTNQLGLVRDSSSPDAKPTFTEALALPDTTLSLPSALGISVVPAHVRASRPAPWSTRSTARARSSRSRSAIASSSQDTTTGALMFRPVVAVQRNKPQPTLRIAIDGKKRSSPPASIASGRPARAGPWPAT